MFFTAGRKNIQKKGFRLRNYTEQQTNFAESYGYNSSIFVKYLEKKT